MRKIRLYGVFVTQSRQNSSLALKKAKLESATREGPDIGPNEIRGPGTKDNCRSGAGF